MPQDAYTQFLDRKAQLGGCSGFAPSNVPDFLFDFQGALVDLSIRKGRAAIFADCGLGKTPMQLVWADEIVRHENKPVLILTPLAVSAQTIQEAEKFQIGARRSVDGRYTGAQIIVTNYERLHYFDPQDFVGCVCDESSILKSFDGVRRKEITEFMRRMPYRLLCTATAAPNDYIELGTSSEALGELGHMDMLNRFFKNQGNTSDTKGRWRGFHAPREFEQKMWRFKGHAEIPFWQWVCSWSRAIRRPSDLGFDDREFVLPPLTETQHEVTARSKAPGYLFSMPAVGLQEQREERRRTIRERCEKVASLVANHDGPSLVWCHLNDEGNLLEEIIPGAQQVSGDDSDEAKEEKFMDFANGDVSALVTKPKIGAWGLNFQNCSHVTFFPSHSFEQYYQGVRRCWRFGQKNPVQVDIVTTEGEKTVLENLQKKAVAADRMFSNLVSEMNRAIGIRRDVNFPDPVEVPTWL